MQTSRLARKSAYISDRWRAKNFPIHQVIYYTEDYIVYINDDLDVDFYREDDKRTKSDALTDTNILLNRASVLESSISNTLSRDIILHCKGLLGDATACILDGDIKSAKEMLDAAAAFILARNREKSRFWYLTYSYAAAAPVVVTGVAASFIIRNYYPSPTNLPYLWVAIYAAAGTLGALVSIITRSGKLEFDAASGKEIHLVESATIAGVIAGFVAKSSLAPKQIANLSDSYLLILLSFAAGSTERYLGSIISNINGLGLQGKATDFREKR